MNDNERAKERIKNAVKTRAIELDLSHLEIDSLPQEIAGLTALEWLDLGGTGVTDLRPIAGLTALKWLDLGDTGVTDLGPIAGLTALERLYLGGTGVTDLRPIAGLTALEWLDIRDTDVLRKDVKAIRSRGVRVYM